MLRATDLSELIETDRDDVLSISLDVDPTRPENQGVPPAYRTWLRNALREILEPLPAERRRAAEALGIVARLDAHRPRGKGLLLFAASGLWREYTVPVPLPNRVRYGRPDVHSALWALDEYEPYAIVAVDREHARMMLAYLGQTTVVEEEALQLDTSDWRFKAGRQPTFAKRSGTGASRGTQRDTFEARVDDHVRRFWQGAAQAASQMLRESRIRRLIIGGPEEAAHAVRDLLTEEARRAVVGLVPLPTRADQHEVRARTLPVAQADEHRREQALVSEVLDLAAAGGGGVVGAQATLDALVREQVMTVVADRDLEGDAWHCDRCGYVGASAVEGCPACGGPVRRLPLTQAVPLLAHRNAARVEIVAGDAAAPLRRHGGLGALLRYVG